MIKNWLEKDLENKSIQQKKVKSNQTNFEFVYAGIAGPSYIYPDPIWTEGDDSIFILGDAGFCDDSFFETYNDTNELFFFESSY